MLTTTKKIIASDPRLKWILLGGLILQIVTSITAIGTSSADQHFQIIEFSMHQLGKPSGAGYTWEMQHFVRQTLQVYIFSGYHLLCNGVGITDPYMQLTILRVALGLGMFVVFNLLAIYYFRNQSRQLLFYVLLLMNFSWSLPYMRTLFSSEMVSSVFFFGTLLLYEARKDKWGTFLFPVLIGLLFSLAFYFRFQTMFAIVGFGVWLVFFAKRYRDITPIIIGFLIGVAINSWLDYEFYREWVFTPYAYFHANINEGRAAQFGTSSFMRYIWLILFVMPAPLFSIIFFIYGIKAFFKRYSNPVFLSVVIFIVAHCLVGHKEERFLFPVFNALPLIAGWAILDLQQVYDRSRKVIKSLLKGLLVFTIVLNVILLTAITLVPYSQTIQFSHLLKKRFEGVPVQLYCLGQTPFETPNGSPMMFYKLGAPNITLVKISGTDTLKYLNGREVYLSAAYNDIKKHKDEIRDAGFRPVMHSSDLLWKVNEFLDSKDKTTINEIWVLYKKGS
jgi:phosphatidylinositol glycan class B